MMRKRLGWISVATCAVALIGCGVAVDDQSEAVGTESEPLGANIKLGTFVSGPGTWYLDSTPDGQFIAGQDLVQGPFGQASDLPLTGYGPVTCGAGGGYRGVYRPGDNSFWLDLNGNAVWDNTDRKISNFFIQGSLAGSWNLRGITWVQKVNGQCRGVVGVVAMANYVGGSHLWIIDSNDNGIFDGEPTDKVYTFGGGAGLYDIPVPIYSTAQGTSVLAVFNAQTGAWYVDENNNKQWDNCTVDSCKTFGAPGDLPFTNPNKNIRGTTRWDPSMNPMGFWKSLDENPDGVWGTGDHYYSFRPNDPFAFLW
jgi:hypothetical protein